MLPHSYILLLLIPAGTFEIGLPNESSRLQILKIFLKEHPLTRGAKNYIPQLAKKTVGYSGSDLKELWYVLLSY